MVFDPLTQNLFWIDSANDRLMKMKVLSNGSHPEPEMLHDYHSNVAQSIALDACNRLADVAFIITYNRSTYRQSTVTDFRTCLKHFIEFLSDSYTG